MNANTSTATDFAAAVDAAVRAVTPKDEPMTGFGCFWRVGGCLILFAAAVFAVMFGMQYAIAYVAALELSALVTSIITWTIMGVGYISCAFMGWKTGGYMQKTLAAREASKCAQSAKA